jgi:hypothetical protein
MKKSIFAALAVTAIISGTTAGAIRQSPQEQLATEEVAAPSITEIGSAPGWHITPAHARMWWSPRGGRRLEAMRAKTMAAPSSAIVMVGALVFVGVTVGITDASITRSRLSPRTGNLWSTTAIASEQLPLRLAR